MSVTPAQIIRADIAALSAYHVPPAAGMVKLDAMENPYPLPAALRAEIGDLCAGAEINRYPDPSAAALRARLAEVMGLPAGMELMLGNGSDELIQILALAVARPGAVLLGVEPSFVMYRMIATFAGLRYVGVPLAPDFSLDRAALLAAIAEHRPALVFFAYPNNPTGNLYDAAVIEAAIRAAPGLVVVDEAYHAFAGRSFLPRLGEFDNLLVMRTLSKLGLAGLRLGMLAGAPAWLAELDKLRLPYNVNVLTQRVAEAVLRRPEVLDQQAARIRADRAELAGRLAGMAGVEVYPSDANFLLLRVAHPDGVFENLKKRGILIKNLNRAHPALAGCLRVTVGSGEENAQFIEALGASL